MSLEEVPPPSTNVTVMNEDDSELVKDDWKNCTDNGPKTD